MKQHEPGPVELDIGMVGRVQEDFGGSPACSFVCAAGGVPREEPPIVASCSRVWRAGKLQIMLGAVLFSTLLQGLLQRENGHLVVAKILHGQDHIAQWVDHHHEQHHNEQRDGRQTHIANQTGALRLRDVGQRNAQRQEQDVGYPQNPIHKPLDATDAGARAIPSSVGVSSSALARATKSRTQVKERHQRQRVNPEVGLQPHAIEYRCQPTHLRGRAGG